MELLNNICWVCATLMSGMACGITFGTFCICVFALFSKKLDGTFIAKLIIMIAFGCVTPWLLRLTLFFAGKI